MPNKQQWSLFEWEYLDERGAAKPTTLWDFKDVNSEKDTEVFIKYLDFKKEDFPNPKSVGTIRRILQITNAADDIILDSFAGTGMIGSSLYTAEEGDMNKPETDLVMKLTALPNVRRWHRNISRHGFCINGFINHRPDIMVMTNSRKIFFAETKGEHLKNDDSREKIALGKAWRNAAGNRYRYYMVFNDGENLLSDAVSVSRFIEIVAAL